MTTPPTPTESSLVPRADADELLACAALLEERERQVLARVERGETTLEIYGFDSGRRA